MTARNPHKPQMRLSRWASGQRITAAHLNEMVDLVARINGGVMPGSQIFPEISGVSEQAMILLRVNTIRRDYLVCETLDTSSGISVIHVARPYLLRRTPFDNQTRNAVTYDYSGLDPRSTAIPQLRIFEEDHVTRLAERPGLGRDGVGTMLKEREVQTIMPIYYTGPVLPEDTVQADIIMAAHVDPELLNMNTEAPDDIVPIEFIDLNMDGRAWQAIFVEAIHSTMIG